MSFRAIDQMKGGISGVAVAHFVEDEELRFRSEKRRVGHAGALQICFRFFRHAARIAIVGLARNRIDDGADQTQRRLGVVDIDPGGRGIGNDEHVAGVDRAPTANAGAIEAEAFRKNFFVILGQRGGEMLPAAGQIGELEVDQLDLAVLDHLADVGCGFFVFGHVQGFGWLS